MYVSLRALFAALLTAFTCSAHSMYQSAVMLDFDSRGVRAELQLPLERMEIVLGHHIGRQLSPDDQARSAEYVVSHFHAHSSAGPFHLRLSAPLAIDQVDGAPYVVAHLILTPPAQPMPAAFDLQTDVLLDRIPSQVTLVSIRSDWSNSVFANDPQLIGVIRSASPVVTVDRTGGNWFNGFVSIFKLGIRHIAEGTDHLLFLLALLLPAPLLFSASRWSGPASIRQSLVRILKVVTAFTVGHSMTLALAALGFVHVPSRPIEVLIAASILVSAVHAIRPIFPGREAAIAAFFGLVHGLAFATTLGELGLGHWERVASIFAFNLGIETMQLVVVVATMPSLILLSRTSAYPIARVSGALFAALASGGWIAERLFGRHTSVDLVVDGIAHQGVWIASSLLLMSLALWGLSRRQNAWRMLPQPSAKHPA